MTFDLLQYDLDLSESVTAAAHIAIEECAFQLRYEKWNCPKRAFFPAHSTAHISHDSAHGHAHPYLSLYFPRTHWGVPEERAIASTNATAERSMRSHATFDKEAAAERLLRSRATSAVLERPSNRETAFVHAVTAAGITHTLIRNCSAGSFDECACDFKMGKRGELSVGRESSSQNPLS